MTDALRAFLEEHRIRDCRLVVAVSGGSDSVALLHLLAGLRQGLRLGLHVAHLDHMLRGAESVRDAEFVRRLAANLELPATIEARDVESWRRAHRGASLEAAAREVRLRFLEEVADEIRAPWIVLGHTADDQAETVLLNLVRGAGLSGLRGMRPVRGRLLRPLLGVRRHDLRAVLDDRDLAFRTDSSNSSLEYRRNRMRGEVLPLLAENFNPRVVRTIARTAATLGRLDSWIAETCGSLLRTATVASTGDRLEIELAPLRQAPEPICEHAIKLAADGLLGQAGELGTDHVESLSRLVRGEASGRVQLPGSLLATVAGERLELAFDRTALPSEEWELRAPIPGEVVLPGSGRRLTLRVRNRPEGFPAAPRTEPDESYMDFDCLGPEPMIRNRRTGDRVHPLGAPGSRKLKEFFIDEKVVAERRAEVPLLADDRGIACIVGHRISERMKVTAKTRRLLHLRLGP